MCMRDLIHIYYVVRYYVRISPHHKHNHHWIKILPSVRKRRDESARIIGYSSFSDTRQTVLLHKWVRNIYIQIQRMSQKLRTLNAKRKKKKKKKLCQKSIQSHFTLISRRSREKKIYSTEWNILTNICAYCAVLLNVGVIHLPLCSCHIFFFPFSLFEFRFTRSFESISEHIFQFDTHIHDQEKKEEDEND